MAKTVRTVSTISTDGGLTQVAELIDANTDVTSLTAEGRAMGDTEVDRTSTGTDYRLSGTAYGTDLTGLTVGNEYAIAVTGSFTPANYMTCTRVGVAQRVGEYQTSSVEFVNSNHAI